MIRMRFLGRFEELLVVCFCFWYYGLVGGVGWDGVRVFPFISRVLRGSAVISL
jgi:hypothetical protein